MKKLFGKPNIVFVLAWVAMIAYFALLSPQKAMAADASSITGTITYNGNGTCTLSCVNNTGNIRVKALVSINNNSTKFQYDLGYTSTTIVVPLNLGNQSYLVRLLYNLEGTSYIAFAQKTVDLSLSDENLPYALPNQIVNYKLSDNAIKESMELVKGCKSEAEVVQTLHRFVLETYSYDYNLRDNTPANYIPNIQNDYVSRKGICYDYSVIFAAMLRIHGIEVKVVFGYPTQPGYNLGAYHAWNQVYDSASKTWYTVDLTYDSTYYHANNSNFTMKKDAGYYSSITNYY